MIESFVDLTYRGLALGRRVKLARVRPTNGYLEIPTPMPVGTTISIVTDEGLVIEALVKAIHEQVGGSDRTPGMLVVPTLAGATDASEPPGEPVPLGDHASWWTARVALPEEEPQQTAPPRAAPKHVEPPKVRLDPVAAPVTVVDVTTEIPTIVAPPPEPPPAMADAEVMAAAAAMAAIPTAMGETIATRSRPVTLRPRSQTLVDPALAGGEVTEIAAPIRISEEHSVPEIVDDGKKTTVMDSIDPALLEQLLRSSSDSLPVVEDTKPTVIMAALDPAALGLDDTRKSGEMAAVEPDDDGGDDKSKPTGSGPVRRRRAQKKR